MTHIGRYRTGDKEELYDLRDENKIFRNALEQIEIFGCTDIFFKDGDNCTLDLIHQRSIEWAQNILEATDKTTTAKGE